MKRYKMIFIALLICRASTAPAQNEWQLKTEKEGIRVYSGTGTPSKFKPVKVECTFNASAAQLVAVLLDIKNYREWVYHTKSATLLKQVSPAELYYYAEINIPWPAQNRDFAAHITTTQDVGTKVITIDASAAPGMVPEKDGLVRIHSNGKWLITPINSKEVKVIYFLQLDPGGGAPAWLVNLFAGEGPLQSFRNLKLQLQKPTYKNVSLPFIKN